MEIWLPLIGYEGLYEISTHGNIRSLDKIRLNAYRGNKFEKGRMLKFFKNTQGYYRVSLTKDKKEWRPMVHNLMCATFFGDKNGRQIRHLDGNRTNNTIWNLKLGTAKENAQDRALHGRTSKGKEHGYLVREGWNKRRLSLKNNNYEK